MTPWWRGVVPVIRVVCAGCVTLGKTVSLVARTPAAASARMFGEIDGGIDDMKRGQPVDRDQDDMAPKSVALLNGRGTRACKREYCDQCRDSSHLTPQFT